MAYEAQYVMGEQARVDYTPSGAITAGQVIVIGITCRVATEAGVSGTAMSLCTKGVFDFAKSTGTGTGITDGAACYWDDSGNVVTTTASTHKFLGYKVGGDAATTDSTARVQLEPQKL